MEAVRQLMRDLTKTCSVELFETYGVSIRAVDELPEVSVELAGIIGFTRQHMRGAMIVGTTSAVLEKSHASAHNTSRRDWSAELANQLLGRVKNRMVARGVDVQMTTPLALRGKALTVDDEGQMEVFDFEGLEGCVRVWLDLELSGKVEVRATEEKIASEGDMMLF
jgi:CheY-specific phosphatase CheX